MSKLRSSHTDNPLQEYQNAIARSFRFGDSTEHSYRPALKTLLENLPTQAGELTATNEPKRSEYGAPDYVIRQLQGHNLITIGYIEAKDVNVSLDKVARNEQMRRYLNAFPNLLLTNYLDFRWYVDGETKDEARLTTLTKTGSLPIDSLGMQKVGALLNEFLSGHVPVKSPEDLSRRMAKLAHMIQGVIVTTFKNKQDSELLRGWRKTFADVLLPELSEDANIPQFADMIAQTLCYGLFSARVVGTTQDSFTREQARGLIPHTNPFLRKFFEQISGVDLKHEQFATYVDDLVSLLAAADMEAILANFGRRTKRQDPVIHFYETFLSAYDPKTREARGVYYTPEPVVSYIVRSVDHVLKTHFDCPDGLAQEVDSARKVTILDPACGTGTFLYGVIDHIREGFMDRADAGMWPSYVRQHLLPRLFGFELLMTPYAVAHFKLGLQLSGRDLMPLERPQWSYTAKRGERLGIYLTNALELSDGKRPPLPGMVQWLADEVDAADTIKRDKPIMVVMGNPPYSQASVNNSKMITDLLHGKLPSGGKTANYFQVDGQKLGERNPKLLNDDYVKFIRFGQYRIETTGAGVLAFVINHRFLDNATFKGMRQALMNSFTDIYLLNLHGSSKKGEKSPDGTQDENVFDIETGVSIGIFIKAPGEHPPARIHYADLWGKRASKYETLLDNNVSTTEWLTLRPVSPQYLFVPQTTNNRELYQQGWSIKDIFPVNVNGFKTHRDDFAIAYDLPTMRQRIQDMRDSTISDEVFRQKYGVTDTRDWKLADARKRVQTDPQYERHLLMSAYRPFDRRACYFDEATMDYPRRELLDHVAGRDNLCLNTPRQTKVATWRHTFVSNAPPSNVYVEIKDVSTVFPLYLYRTEAAKKRGSNALNPELFEAMTPDPAHDNRVPNLNPDYVKAFADRVGLRFVPFLSADDPADQVFTPRDIFDYVYAVLHAPGYRSQYADFLKYDFPRVPLPVDAGQFRALARLGAALVLAHLLESRVDSVVPPSTPIVYPVAGDNVVEKGYPKYEEPKYGEKGRLYLNRTQYFEGVPSDVWKFQIGGYQVAEKWLKDRSGRELSYVDQKQYKQILAALAETIRLMREIDGELKSDV